MKILLITQYAPYPPDSGVKVRIHNLIKCLLGISELVCIYLQEGERIARDEAIPGRIKEYDVQIAREKNPVKRYLCHLTQLAGIMPQGLTEVRRIIEKESPQVLWLEFGYICHFIPHLRGYGLPILYGAHNCQFDLDYQRWRREGNLLKLLKAAPLIPLWYYHQNRFVPLADCVCCLSRQDMDYYMRFIPSVRVAYMPFIYDQSGASRVGAAAFSHPYACMIGSLRSIQNYEAAIYALEKLWPKISSRNPHLHLYLIGQLPNTGSSEYRKLEGLALGLERVSLLGRVDSVIPFLKGALLNMVPVTVGSGVRTKIIESAACGTPVVSTSIGAAGLPFVDGESIFIADGQTEFVERVLALSEDEACRRRIAGGALRVFTEELSIEAGRRALAKIFQDMESRGFGAFKGGDDA